MFLTRIVRPLFLLSLFAFAPAPFASAAASGPTSCAAVAASPATAAPPLSPAAGTPAAKTPGLEPVADIPLPGGATRFDYQSFDQSTGRLWIAHMGDGQLLAFDTVSRAVVATIKDLPGVTGVLALPNGGAVYASSTGDHTVAVIDPKTNAVTARLGPIKFPDGLDEAPDAGRIFVSDESGGGELVIDAASNKVVATIDIGGEAGNTRYDAGSGCILVAVQSTDQMIAIDPGSLKVVARYDLDARCQGPHGFTLDAPNRLAFVTCEGNAKLFVLDLRTMTAAATFTVGSGPDVLAFDGGLRRLYVASESGVVSAFDETGAGLEPSGEYRAPHAHSIAIDPATHLVYLPLENVNGKPVLRIMQPAPTSES